jgi:Flp pilus assembly protein TadG
MMKTLPQKNKGQTLVEWALVLPIMLLIVFVVFDLGRGIYYYSVVYNAAREGARYGVVFPEETEEIRNAAAEKAIGLDPSSLTIFVNGEVVTPVCDTDTYSCVHIRYGFVPVTPMVSTLFGGGTVNLNSRSTMVLEW